MIRAAKICIRGVRIDQVSLLKIKSSLRLVTTISFLKLFSVDVCKNVVAL